MLQCVLQCVLQRVLQCMLQCVLQSVPLCFLAACGVGVYRCVVACVAVHVAMRVAVSCITAGNVAQQKGVLTVSIADVVQ